MASTGFELDLVRKSWKQLGQKDLSQPAHARRPHIDDPSSLILPGLRRQIEPHTQCIHEELHFVEREAMRLKRYSSMVCRSVVHEPNGHGERGQIARDLDRNHLLPVPVEALMPLREQRTRSRRELHTRETLLPELLIESVQRHRHEVSEDVALEFDQRPMSRLVLDVQAMEPTMSGQTPIAQQGSHEDRLLPASEVLRTRTSLGVVLSHQSIVWTGSDRRFTDIAGFAPGLPPERTDTDPVCSPSFRA